MTEQLPGVTKARSEATGRKVTVFIAGDSTACNYEPSRAPRAGWGQMIGTFFDGQYVSVVNRAISGRSSMSFINEGALAEILSEIKTGDYLLIQFGHNDSKQEDPTRYSDLSTYQT